MSADAGSAEPLQFDTAVPSSVTSAAQTPSALACARCAGSITEEYFDLNGQSVCVSCREAVEHQADTPRDWSVFAGAVVIGVVAAILGAVLYYAVMAITDLEIGIVAIAIGYMVGYGIRMATTRRGGRRYQVLAAFLTYWAVGLAYTPLVFSQAIGQASQSVEAGAEGVAGVAPAEAPSTEAPAETSVAMALASLLMFTLTLPILVVTASMPSGLISGAIIAFGMLQAWRMTGVPHLVITGPFRIAPPTTPA